MELDSRIRICGLYVVLAVVPSVAWDFLFDKHINLTYLTYLTYLAYLTYLPT